MHVTKYKGFGYKVEHLNGKYCGTLTGVEGAIQFTAYSYEDIPRAFQEAVDKHIRDHLRSETPLAFPK